MRVLWWAAVLAAGPLALPALAEETAPQALFDQRVSMEWETWSLVGTGSGAGQLSFNTPMTVFTVTDRSGVLMGAATNVAANESRRIEARDEAIRNDKRSYSWRVEEGHPLDGTRFSFTVGMGGVSGLSASGGASGLAGTTGAQVRMAKLDLEGDVFELGGGSFVLNTGIEGWDAVVPGTVVTNASFKLGAFDWPIGVKYRWSPPFLPGLVIEPAVSFNWLYTAYTATNGHTSWDARALGVDVGYYLLPNVKLRGSYFLDRMPHDKLDWMQESDMVDFKAANAGLMMTF